MSSVRSVLAFSYIYRKAFPLQAWTGSDISRMLRLPDFKTISI